MALPAVHFLFLLFSMLPLLQASPCPRGEYCPEGFDCREDKTFCQPGTCPNGPNITLCDGDIVVGFTSRVFVVNEFNGPVEPVLRISSPLYCCPISVKVLVEDITTDSKDFTHPRGGVVQVIFRPGTNTASFQLKIENDRISELTESFRVTIIEVSVPRGVTTQGGYNTAVVNIFDDDPACVSIQRPTYSVRENSPSVRVAVVLNPVASYPIDVIIDSFEASATFQCDFDPTPYRVHIKPGDRQAYFDVTVNDDDIYEGTETFSIVISNVFNNNHVQRCGGYSSIVTITDDEREIAVRFEKTSYTVNEDVGTVVPVLKLDEPSPCCITVYAELTSGTRSSDATGGGVDYGYDPPKLYEFTFNAGETCSTPSVPIPIIDDMISETDERFTISIIDDSVPYGVRVSGKSATITIKDNDIAVCFERPEYEISENDGSLRLRLKLDKTLKEDTVIQVSAIPNSALPTIDYSPGPYNVSIKKNRRESEYFFIDIVPDNDAVYTGNKNFSLIIDTNGLNSGLVPCVTISMTIIIIVDVEYIICFETRFIEVYEGENVDFSVSVSRRLSSPASVKLIYEDAPSNPATRNVDYTPRTSVSIREDSVAVSIPTKRDKIVERNEVFFIHLDRGIQPKGSYTCIIVIQVIIINIDITICYFEFPNYPRSISNFDKNELLKPVIKLKNAIAYPIEVSIQAEDDTAKAGEDYKVEYTNPIMIYPGDKSEKTIFVDAIDDDRVEILQECLTLKIIDVNDPNVYIDEENNFTKLTIVDDDVSKLIIIQERLDFSKAIFEDVPVQVLYTGSTVPKNYTLVATESSIDLDAAKNGIEEIKVCIPDTLYDERTRRVVTEDTEKIKIVPRRSC